MSVQVPESWLKPKNDYVFKLLIGNDDEVSKELLLAFLNDVLNVPEGLSLEAVEIQLTNKKNIHKRSLYYGTKLYEEQLGEGEDYRRLSRVVAINIIDFRYFTADAYRSC